MKLFIEIPTWLGDAVMATGAIERLVEFYTPQEVTIFGSEISTSLFKDRYRVIVDNRKARVRQLFSLPKADLAVSFRSHFYSKLALHMVAKERYIFRKSRGHQVEQYSKFVNQIVKESCRNYPPKLHFKPKEFKRPTLGLNAGASYGSAKRWYPKEFAEVANRLADKYDILIFGGPNERDIADEIESYLEVSNYKNIAGELTIKELCEHIGGLSLFITNDSGPMHIASAYNTPMVAIFGPTDYKETSPYSRRSKIVTKNLPCSPCKKRECPLKGEDYHRCMREIKAEDVLKAVEELR